MIRVLWQLLRPALRKTADQTRDRNKLFQFSDEENPSVVYDTPGFYSVTLVAGNGVDEVTETKTEYIHVLADAGPTTPIHEGFENMDEISSEDWYVWSAEAEDDAVWEITDNAAASGSQSIILANYFQDEGYKDILESNSIDLSNLTDVDISFNYAYAKRNSSNSDILKVKVTKNCGGIWK